MTLSGNQSKKDAAPKSPADVTVTSELWARTPRPPNVEDEAAAMRLLGDVLKTEPAQVFQRCVEVGLQLCRAQSCGISLREKTETGEDIFRWIAVAGELQRFLNGTMPRFFSPCGVCVDDGAPILMRLPERFYTYIDVGTPLPEVLLIPLIDTGSGLEGTIWIVAHDETRKFDGEDARVMQRIAVFVAVSLSLANMAQDAKGEAADKELAFRELDHRVKNTLAMTAGMLRHQLRQTAEPAARDAIESASTQVLAVGRAHQIASGVGAVDLAAIVTSVCTGVLAGDSRFELAIEAAPAIIPAHRASVMALIVNELITNAVKYGLQGRERGAVSVSLSRTGENALVLSVTDDGVPLPVGQFQPRAGGGLDLVGRLAKQLGGELIVESEPKRFAVTFPAGIAQ